MKVMINVPFRTAEAFASELNDQANHWRCQYPEGDPLDRPNTFDHVALRIRKEREKAIADVAEKAIASFWQTVADEIPEVTSGDFTPSDTRNFEIACQHAIDRWLELNQ